MAFTRSATRMGWLQCMRKVQDNQPETRQILTIALTQPGQPLKQLWLTPAVAGDRRRPGEARSGELGVASGYSRFVQQAR